MDKYQHIAELRRRQAAIDKWIGPDDNDNGPILGSTQSVKRRSENKGTKLHAASSDKCSIFVLGNKLYNTI